MGGRGGLDSRFDEVVRQLRLQPRPDLDLAKAGWLLDADADADDSLSSLLWFRDAQELERLVLVSMADWLQQAEDVDTNGFGGSDRTGQLYWEGGVTAGHWHWVEGGVRSFRAEGYRTMLTLLDCLCGEERREIARAARVSFDLVYERLGRAEPASTWTPDQMAPKL